LHHKAGATNLADYLQVWAHGAYMTIGAGTRNVSRFTRMHASGIVIEIQELLLIDLD